MRFNSSYKLIVLSVFVIFLSVPVVGLAETNHFPLGTSEVSIPVNKGIRSDLLNNIAPLIQKSIREGKYPGAVILASHRGHIIYRGVFGSRRILPQPAPMRFNTIFDLASLTKVVATTPAIMQLVEQGKIDLDSPAAKYWPEFAEKGKSLVTIRELLTHTSGLPADLSPNIKGQAAILKAVTQLKLNDPPGKHYLYSDVNFVVLAYLVERISHQSFSEYTHNHLFNVLRMSDTAFLPNPKWHDRIAPTMIIDKKLRWGVVQDPLAYAMGGVSGNAGLFSTASDLAKYAQCLLNNGRIRHRYLLGPLTVLKMTTPETLPGDAGMRGLGWDIDSPYSNRGLLFPVESYGHTGWTGTSIWIDPATQTWIIMLTSRTHPTITHQNQVIEDRRTIATIIAASITDTPTLNQNNTGKGELARAYHVHE